MTIKSSCELIPMYFFCDCGNILLPNDIIILSNHGVDQELPENSHGGTGDLHGRPN
jgi:hypothetical protein